MRLIQQIPFMLALGVLLLLVAAQPIQSQAADDNPITSICPAVGIQDRGAEFQPGGIILTTFDKSAIWVYNVDNGRRYPLPETSPCGRNCTLSPDATWLTFFNDPTNTFNKMRLDGTERSLIVENAAEVLWWNADTLLVWTPAKRAYLKPENGDERDYLDVNNVNSVQPGGRYGVLVEPKDDGFERFLVDLDLRDLKDVSDGRVDLGVDQAYFNAQSWSPDGAWLAYVAPVKANNRRDSGEIFAIQPGQTTPTQWTHLTDAYGAVRINGLSVGELSWSPDGTRIAFWVTAITGGDVTTTLGTSTIYILDVATGSLTTFCNYATHDQTPNPSRLVWSPDGTTIAFAGVVPGGAEGYHLLALDTATGVITSLSVGVYPVFGSPDVIAWGTRP